MASGDTSQIKYASGTSTSDGAWSSPLVAAVTGKKIRVLALSISVLTTAGSVALAGGAATWTVTLLVGTPLVAGGLGVPVYETTSGAALTPSNGTGVDSFINVSYQEIDA